MVEEAQVMMPATPRRHLRRDAERNRERVLAAAAEVFAERGIEATLDDVAERAGVGVGTVYRRYPNKYALIQELFSQRVAEVSELAEGLLSAPDAWGALVSFFEAIEEAFAKNRALEQLVLHPDLKGGQYGQDLERALGPVAALVERAKAEGRLRADFAPDDVGMVHAMLAAVIRETHASSPELWRRYLVMILDGLVTERSSPTPTGIAPCPVRLH